MNNKRKPTPINFCRLEPERITCPNGKTGYVMLEALRALTWAIQKPNTLQRAVARVKKRVPVLDKHIFLTNSVEPGPRRCLIDFEGMQLLLKHLPSRMVGIQRRDALDMKHRMKQGDIQIVQEVIRNNNNVSDLSLIQTMLLNKLKTLQ